MPGRQSAGRLPAGHRSAEEVRVGSADGGTKDTDAIGGARLAAQEALPFPPTPSASRAGRTMQESSYENRVQPRRLPEDAPNILILLIDDAGPGLPDTLGGEVRTDTLSRVRDDGLGFNRFHTTAMCSPTR